MRFYIETLGCQKNTVDSEALRASLVEAGHEPVESPALAEVSIVNTCGFIDVAKQQSIDRLIELGREKREGQLLIAAGCLSQRFPDELRHELPELDGVVGVDAWKYLPPLLDRRAARRARLPQLPVLAPGAAGFPTFRRTAQGPSADVKISEGCNYGCTFCAIPIMKGRFRSKPLDRIVHEARDLAAAGVREVVLVSQDSTAYGTDLRDGTDLATLLETLAERVPELPWVRVLYVHPDRLSHKLIRRLPAIPTFCHYVDVPVQHAHPDVLRRMRRGSHSARTEELLLALRQAIPDVALRTSFIVGFPGETEEEFEYLVEWARRIEFDHAGVFLYSAEEGTPGASMEDQVPHRVKQRRRRRLMSLHEEISARRAASFLGRTLTMLVEGNNASAVAHGEPPTSIGRSYRDAPEVDGTVIVRGVLPIGELAPVRITGATAHDLIGIPA